MAKIKKRGESGSAKNYITRTQALKKLQISLSDFRRLCILKGIYPREPANKKKANKGSSAPASFYYSKDILYLLHEPLLNKFREHKTFAKKLARALGRGEWALAKGLEDRKPVARLDHLVKERYPTFKLALQDLNDPLSLLCLFERLPKNPVPGKTEVPVDVTAECGRLVSEWKVWAIRTHSLRKIFLSIKGVYYECEVPGGQGGETVNVRWLEPWEFKQTVPTDVDFRILLTFLDLYRTLTSFILFKLYTDENLVYPPPLDVKLDEAGEGVGKFRLVEKDSAEAQQDNAVTIGADGKKVTKKDVKKSIRSITLGKGETADVDMEEEQVEEAQEEAGEDFIYRPSRTDIDGEPDASSAPLPTYTSLLASSSSAIPSTSNLLFSPFTFFLSRETSSRTWEFVIRAFGGKVVSLPSLETASQEELDTLTHVVIDRPTDSARMSAIQGERKWTWIQPQWLADCVNQKKLLPSGSGSGYEPGGTLPPHLSPWDSEGENDRPWLGIGTDKAAAGEDAEMEVEEEDEDEEEGATKAEAEYPPALLAAALNPSDSTLLHQAELEAESNGTDHAAFKKQLAAATKANASKAAAASTAAGKGKEEDQRKIMMTGKKQRLYEKMQYSNNERKAEQENLQRKKKAIEKKKKAAK